MRRLVPVLLLALAMASTTGCNAVTKGSRLSNNPHDGQGLFISTGGSPKRYKTLGFVQIRGYGVEVAGFADLGDAQLDGTIKGTLAQEAARMGGNGVINVEFYDENPSTDIERMNAAANSITNIAAGQGKGPETKDRYVTVTGEVIQFLE